MKEPQQPGTPFVRLAALALLACPLAVCGAGHPGLVAVTPLVQWTKAEFRIDGVPTAANNFDPDQIAIDATIVPPSGRSVTVPAFWYQDFTRALSEGTESVEAAGPPHWLLRYTPAEAGDYGLTLSWRLAGQLSPESVGIRFTVAPGPAAERSGWVRVAPDHRYFETSDGSPLRLIGANVCWPEEGGTYDFDGWFSKMAAVGENFARVWLSPWWAGIEHQPGTLNHYQLAEAWRLDQVFERADEDGIYLLLSLDHHGMYQVDNGNWGGKNNFWTTNPYSTVQGGPCEKPNDFFTSAAARDIYRKRLRYLVARYGYSRHLLAWQLFNEIDNVFNRGLNGPDVVAWHREMGTWLRAHDPYGHLVTTSLTGGSDRPEMWVLPELDFAVYHSYNDPALGRKIAALSNDDVLRYGKPMLVDEFGIDGATWNLAADPYLRGFRQALWSGALGGSAGTAMSWWWQDMDKNDVYPLFAVVSRVLGDAGWRDGVWAPASVPSPQPTPVELGRAGAGAEVFDAPLALNTGRRLKLSGFAAIASPLAAARSSEQFSAFLYGAKNPELAHSLKIAAEFSAKAKMVFRIKSAASDNEVVVRLGGVELLRTRVERTDLRVPPSGVPGREFELDIPAGRQTIEIAGEGADWTQLESVRLVRVRAAGFAGGWNFRPEIAALRSGNRAIVYVTSPWIVYPAGALVYHPPQVVGASVTILSWPEGSVRADWYSPVEGSRVRSTFAEAAGGKANIPVPEFNEDLVGVISKL